MLAPQHATIINNVFAWNHTFFLDFFLLFMRIQIKAGLQHRSWSKLRDVKNRYLSFLPSSVILSQLSKACLQAVVAARGVGCSYCTLPICRSSSQGPRESSVEVCLTWLCFLWTAIPHSPHPTMATNTLLSSSIYMYFTI